MHPLLFLLTIEAVRAEGANPPEAIKPLGNSNNTSLGLENLMQFAYAGALEILLALITGMAAIYIVWAGIQYLSSNGNPEKAKSARAGIINAVIGIVVAVLVYLIFNAAVGLANFLANIG